LENKQRLASLKYWIKTWKDNGAQIDGINAELNLSYSEDANTQADNKKALDDLLDNLAATGLLIRVYNFDIKYQDADGAAVKADKITKAQRQKLADYYAYVIKAYMEKIPKDKQAGMCKGNIFDTSSGNGDPVGLWSAAANGDWLRNATYEAFCNALSGK
jgi:thiamine pyrophosphate-dependent acetolactate synthase large subunit-like protein